MVLSGAFVSYLLSPRDSLSPEARVLCSHYQGQQRLQTHQESPGEPARPEDSQPQSPSGYDSDRPVRVGRRGCPPPPRSSFLQGPQATRGGPQAPGSVQVKPQPHLGLHCSFPQHGSPRNRRSRVMRILTFLKIQGFYIPALFPESGQASAILRAFLFLHLGVLYGSATTEKLNFKFNCAHEAAALPRGRAAGARARAHGSPPARRAWAPAAGTKGARSRTRRLIPAKPPYAPFPARTASSYPRRGKLWRWGAAGVSRESPPRPLRPGTRAVPRRALFLSTARLPDERQISLRAPPYPACAAPPPASLGSARPGRRRRRRRRIFNKERSPRPPPPPPPPARRQLRRPPAGARAGPARPS